jgi:hypothetical protein
MAKCKSWAENCEKWHRWHSRRPRGVFAAEAVLVGGSHPYIQVSKLGTIDGPENLRALANAILAELKPKRPKRRKAG